MKLHAFNGTGDWEKSVGKSDQLETVKVTTANDIAIRIRKIPRRAGVGDNLARYAEIERRARRRADANMGYKLSDNQRIAS